MDLLSLEVTKLFIQPVCPFKIASCFLSKKFQILIFLSVDPEIIYLLSSVTAMLETLSVCPCKNSCQSFSNSSTITDGSVYNSFGVLLYAFINSAFSSPISEVKLLRC